MKLKFQWGTGIAIAFTLFATGIVYAVVTAVNQDIQVISANYYQDELNYQQTINKKEAALNLPSQPTVAQTAESVTVTLPTQANRGTITFMRPADKALDRTLAMQPTKGNTFSLPATTFTKGLYNLKIEWEANNTQYLTQQTFWFN